MITLHDFTTNQEIRLDAERIDDDAALRLLPPTDLVRRIYTDFRADGQTVMGALNRALLCVLAARSTQWSAPSWGSGPAARGNERQEDSMDMDGVWATGCETPRPCPFCGGEGRGEHMTAGNGEPRYFVVCRSCACEGGWGRSPASAVRWWNTRAGEKEIKAERDTALEQLRSAAGLLAGDDQGDYGMLRDAIIRLLDPADDDAAELSILISAVEDVKEERDTALHALALSVEVVRALLRANGGKPLGDELRGRVMAASEAAAVALRPWRDGQTAESARDAT